MNKKIGLGLFVVLFILVGPTFIQPVFADSVINTAPPVLSKNTKTWKTFFNVTNSGTNKEAIYDVHMTINGADLISVSRPKSWKSKVAGQTVTWSTDKDPILDGFKNEGFDIGTSGPNYRVNWETTNASKGVIDSGSFVVGTT